MALAIALAMESVNHCRGWLLGSLPTMRKAATRHERDYLRIGSVMGLRNNNGAITIALSQRRSGIRSRPFRCAEDIHRLEDGLRAVGLASQLLATARFCCLRKGLCIREGL